MAIRDNLDRDTEIIKLRTEGWTFEQIGAQYGITGNAAYKAYRRTLALVPAEAVSELRNTEKQRLESVIRELWAIAHARHPYVNQGRVFDNIEDVGPKLTALAGIVRASESLRKLYGVDAPNRVAISVVTEDAIDAEIKRLSEQVGQIEAPKDPAADA